MGYLTNNTKIASLTINGVDQTDYLVSFTCSDASANKNGLISTTGQISLESYGESPSLVDYDRNNFRRGHQVIIDVTLPSGSTVRHPRGLLYVLSTSYEPESDTLSVEVGCRLALAALTEDVSEILPLAPIQLDASQQTYQNISASFASAGKYLFQDNQGSLIEGSFFGTDSTASTQAGEWVSAYGITTQSASPLAGTSPIPDSILLSYQVPADLIAEDETGRVEVVTTTSQYFLSYPAVMYIRKPAPLPGLPDPEPQPPDPIPTPTPSVSGCGNVPDIPSPNLPAEGPSESPTPGGEEINSCSSNYETKQQTTYVPARRIELQRTEYSAPGAQVGYVYTEVRGPAFEVNGQYYADELAFCRANRSTGCNPNGGCKMGGLSNIKQSYTTQRNFYGASNELVKQITDSYESVLAGAIPSDYRSGEVDGESTTWRSINPSRMYRVSRVQQTYQYSENQSIQDTITWTSSTSRGSGIRAANIDALSGVKTSQRRISTTITTRPIKPDLLNTVSTSTTERTTTLLLDSQYVTPPSAAGPYVLEEQIPVPILSEDEAFITSTVNAYSSYITRFVLGDSYGISLTEGLREEIITNWRPGMPFRYYDPRNGNVLALRMDASAWGIDASSCVVGTNGIWCGISNGTITIPDNLSGNSAPDMGAGGTPAPGPGLPPSISGETSVNSGTYGWVVNVDIGLSVVKDFWKEQGILPITPTDLTYDFSATLSIWCAGLIVGPGDLLGTNATGSIPFEYAGSLVVDNATIVDGDLFTA